MIIETTNLPVNESILNQTDVIECTEQTLEASVYSNCCHFMNVE